ncbi:HPr family phosphocarrier protein [Eubacterium sp.]
MLSVLAASVKYNDEVEIVCEGEDEKEALEGVVALIQSGLGE